MGWRYALLLVLVFYEFGPAATPKSNAHGNEGPSAIRSEESLDQEAIQRLYSNSDWDVVKNQLESYLRRKGDGNVREEERIFAYKYLGVIYAADSLTTARAESYFHRLLDLSPEIDILDMFASKRVNNLFAETKSDHRRRAEYNKNHDRYGKAITSTSSNAKDSSSISKTKAAIPFPASRNEKQAATGNHSWIWWTSGSIIIAGAATAIFLLSTQDENSKTKVTSENVDAPTTLDP
jgi:hypothetical protein